MAIYLVQHGLAVSGDVDPHKPLSTEGIEKVRLIGGVAANYRVEVAGIEHSGKKRALQTAEIFDEILSPKNGIRMRDGLGPNDDVAVIGDALDEKSQLMLVSHLPFLERLASWLITGDTTFTPFKFQNGGIVCLDRESGEQFWHVKWALMPEVG